MAELEGRVALVSGASRGLGAAIARALAGAGAAVGVNFVRSADAAAAVVADIEAAGGRALAVQGDVTTADGAATVVAATVAAFDRLDVLVNNAVGPHPPTAIDDAEVGTYDDQLRFAVAAPVQLLARALPLLRAGDAGRVINIGSEIVSRPAVGYAAYTTAKAAMVGLTRAWATELGGSGITVNLVAPGFVPVERHADVPAADRDAYVADVPVGRIGVPEDVAGAVAFLASDAGAFVTGQVLTVNGGRTVGL